MNRNVQSHFSVNPINIDIQRSRFDRPYNHKFSGNVSEIIPWFIDEVLPGDTYEAVTSKVVRFPAFLKPVMDSLYMDTYWFYVPMRLVWEHTKEFYGENTQSAWYPTTEYTIPQLRFPATGSTVGSIADHLGMCPPGQGPIEVNALQARVYNKVYEDWFRSEAIQDPVNLYFGDSTVDFDANDPLRGGKPYRAAKYHDYFTSALPSAQRGPTVQFDLIDSAQITIPSKKMQVEAEGTVHSMGSNLKFGTESFPSNSGVTVYRMKQDYTDPNGVHPSAPEDVLTMGSFNYTEGGITVVNSEPVYRSNLYVQYPGVSSVPITGVNALSVNELRMAFQLQKWYEKSALYGGRYTSMIRGQYSVQAPDASLQRSEYLGGNRIPINITQVENTAGESTPLGSLGAFSATSDVSHDFIKSFTEPGYVIAVSVVRYTHTYSQGVEKQYLRKTMQEFYFPVFANLGNMPIKNAELYVSGDSEIDNGVFGYQEAYADYRYKPDSVSGLMRPGVQDSLASWHFADYYTETPNLSPDWLVEDPVNVDRTLAVTHDVTDQYFADFHVDLKCTRPMPLYSIPGLIDHH